LYSVVRVPKSEAGGEGGGREEGVFIGVAYEYVVLIKNLL